MATEDFGKHQPNAGPSIAHDFGCTHDPCCEDFVVVEKSVVGGLTANVKRWRGRASAERLKRQRWRKRALAAEAEVKRLRAMVDFWDHFYDEAFPNDPYLLGAMRAEVDRLETSRSGSSEVPAEAHTVDVGHVHVLAEPGGPCAPGCPHPDHRTEEP